MTPSLPQSGRKSSRYERMRHNPLPWVVLLVIVGLWGVLWLLPRGLEWVDLRAQTTRQTAAIPQLQSDVKALEQELATITEEFDSRSQSFVNRESQLLPASIDTMALARALELMAYQLENLDGVDTDGQLRDARMRLNSLQIGPPTAVEGKTYQLSDVSMSLTCDRPSLKLWVDYLQQGRLPDVIFAALQGPRSVLEPADITFLEGNLPPVTNIESITLDEAEDGLLSVNLKAVFYSQPRD